MADRRLIYTVEIDATQTEAAARKLREAMAQITAGAGQSGQKADPAARQVESLKAAEAQAKETAKALGAISGINVSTAGLDQLRERLSQIRREANLTQAELARVMGEGGSGRSQQDAARFAQLVTNVRNMVDDTTANRLQNVGYAPAAWLNAQFPPEHPEQYEKFFQGAAAKEANMSGAGGTRLSTEAKLDSLRLEAEAADLKLQEAQLEKAIAQREIDQTEKAIAALANRPGDNEDEYAALFGAMGDLQQRQAELVAGEAELMQTAATSVQKLNDAVEKQKAELARAALSETGDIETFAASKTGAGSNTLNIGVTSNAVERAKELTTVTKNLTEELREQSELYKRIADRVSDRYTAEHAQLRQTNAERQAAERQIALINKDATTESAASRAAEQQARAAAAAANKEKEAIRAVTLTAKAEADERTAKARAESVERIQIANRETARLKAELAEQTAAAKAAAAQQSAARRASMFGPGSTLGQMFSPTNLMYGAAGALGIYSADQVMRQMYGGGREGAQQIRQMETFKQFAGRLNVDATALIAGIKKASNETITETDAMGIAAQTLAQKFAASSSDIVGDLEQIVAFSRRASQIYTDEQGQFLSTQEVFARLIKFTREGNKELVDQFGLTNQRIADALGMSVKGLASASGATDRWRGLIKVLGEEMDRLGAPIQTVADKIEQSEARITSATNRIKQALAPTTAGIAEFGAGAAEGALTMFGGADVNMMRSAIATNRSTGGMDSLSAGAYEKARAALTAYDAAMLKNSATASMFTASLQPLLNALVNQGTLSAENAAQLDELATRLRLVASGQDAYTKTTSVATMEQIKASSALLEYAVKMAELESLFVSGRMSQQAYTTQLYLLATGMATVKDQIVSTLPAMREFAGLAYAVGGTSERMPFVNPESPWGPPEGMTQRQVAAGYSLNQWRANQAEQRKADAEANYDYTAEGQEKLRTQFAMKLHEEQAQEDRRLAEQTAQKAQSEWEAAAKAAQAKWESAISSIPGLFGTSSVTGEQMDAAAAGVPQRFADSWLRELKDEVYNNIDRPNVDIRDAARRVGFVDPNADPKAIYQQIEAAWRDSSLFVDGANLDLIDLGAVQADLDRQAAGASGQQAIKDYLASLGMGPGKAEEETPADAVLPAPEDMKDKAAALTGAIKTAFDGEQVRADFEAVGGAVLGYIHAGYASGALKADWTGPIVDAVVAQLSGQLAGMLEGDEGAPPPP